LKSQKAKQLFLTPTACKTAEFVQFGVKKVIWQPCLSYAFH